MFSGIIEATSKVIFIEKRDSVVRVAVYRPEHFEDIKIGDSISCNGVCLTIEKFGGESIQLSLAHETLQLLKIDSTTLVGQLWNLERSLRFGDRVHGHLVTGHVEAIGEVTRSEALGESWMLDFKVPEIVKNYIWKKGSIAVQGVSLTVNEFDYGIVSVCLIPETLKKTNLSSLKVGHFVNVETDYLAKAYFHSQKEIQQNEF